MNFSTTLKPGEEDKQVFLVLGNGVGEERLLRHLLPALNGKERSVVYPSLPGIRREKKGASALEALAVLSTIGYRIKRALFIVDREHIKGVSVIRHTLTTYGFRINAETTMQKDSVLRFSLTKGPSTTTLYVVVCGKQRSMDEELAELCLHVYGRILTPDHARQKLRDLFDKASSEQIARAFGGVVSTIGELERD